MEKCKFRISIFQYFSNCLNRSKWIFWSLWKKKEMYKSISEVLSIIAFHRKLEKKWFMEIISTLISNTNLIGMMWRHNPRPRLVIIPITKSWLWVFWIKKYNMAIILLCACALQSTNTVNAQICTIIVVVLHFYSPWLAKTAKTPKTFRQPSSYTIKITIIMMFSMLVLNHKKIDL